MLTTCCRLPCLLLFKKTEEKFLFLGNEIAHVTPNAVAYAGIGGIAGAAPVGTAFIANSGLASSAPRATAIAGTSDQSPDFVVAPAKTVYIARYTPQRKYHIDTVAL